jgi:hypothetical protein
MEKDSQIPQVERKETVERYSNEAIELLREAVRRGFTDASWLQKDPDIAFVRDRADFKEIVTKLALQRS